MRPLPIQAKPAPWLALRLATLIIAAFGLLAGLTHDASAATPVKARRTNHGVVLVGEDFPENSHGKVTFAKRARRGGVVIKHPRRTRTVQVDEEGRFRLKVKAAKRFKGRVWVRARFIPDVTTTVSLKVAKAPRLRRKGSIKITPPPTTTTAHHGIDPTFVPEYDVEVPVGSLSPEFVDAYPQGTRFALAPGVHRLQDRIRPRARQQFLGMPGAVVSGAKKLSNFRREGAWWVADGQTQRLFQHGQCASDYEGCRFAEDVFVDDVPLWQVTDITELAPGRFFFDYEHSRIYLADDPAGHAVETTVAESAFWGQRRDGSYVSGVTVRNLTIEKFGSQAQRGAVDSGHGTDWVIASNVIRLNHGAGVYADAGSRISGNKIVQNGQLGLAGGKGLGVIVEDNEIAYNNWAGFSYGWEAGGTKWTRSDGLIVRRNWSHHNHGPGLWTDEGNINTIYEGNVVEDNYSSGIFHEISYAAEIRDNIVRRNGHGDPKWGYGAGIQISASSNVTVTGNLLEHNARGITLIMQERGTGPYGLRETFNVQVSDNTLGAGNGPTGLFQDIGDTSYFTDRNNRFTRNSYVLGDVEKPFAWMNGSRTPQEWRAYGNDTEGTFER